MFYDETKLTEGLSCCEISSGSRNVCANSWAEIRLVHVAAESNQTVTNNYKVCLYGFHQKTACKPASPWSQDT